MRTTRWACAQSWDGCFKLTTIAYMKWVTRPNRIKTTKKSHAGAREISTSSIPDENARVKPYSSPMNAP